MAKMQPLRLLYALALVFTLAELRSAECRQACVDRPRDGYTGGLYVDGTCRCTHDYPYEEMTHRDKKLMRLNPMPVPTVDARDFMPPLTLPTDEF